jgi:hypothetical protein
LLLHPIFLLPVELDRARPPERAREETRIDAAKVRDVLVAELQICVGVHLLRERRTIGAAAADLPGCSGTDPRKEKRADDHERRTPRDVCNQMADARAELATRTLAPQHCLASLHRSPLSGRRTSPAVSVIRLEARNQDQLRSAVDKPPDSSARAQIALPRTT